MISKPQMNNRTRFAKCFLILVEQCKSWLVVFAENRVKSCSSSSTVLTMKQFINASTVLSTDRIIKTSLKKMKTSSDLDITALRSIIVDGNLLGTGETQTKFHAGKTIGDFIDRIREIRNNFMHTAKANLIEQEYNDYLGEFRYIATRFEKENKVSAGCYVKEIEKIDKEPLDSEEVEKTVMRYNMYLQIIIKTELPEIPSLIGSLSNYQCQPRSPTPPPARPNVYQQQEYLTVRLANGVTESIARRTNNPVAQIVGGVVGGTVGLAADIVNAPWRVLESYDRNQRFRYDCTFFIKPNRDPPCDLKARLLTSFNVELEREKRTDYMPVSCVFLLLIFIFTSTVF